MKKFFYTFLLLFVCDAVTLAQVNYYQANNPNIQYMGRLDKNDPAQYFFSWSGVSISTKFLGTEISAVIKDFSTGTNITTNYFNVFIDGERVSKMAVNNTDTLYLLASGLSNNVHIVEITKRTEASVGMSSFKGFVINGTIQESDPLPSFKMEVIGDSRSCGYGNEVSYENPNEFPGFNSVNEDNYYAWSAITARNLGFQYHCTAYSGRGMYRNNTGATSGVLPEIYNRIHPDQSSPIYDHTNYTPNLIIILLGTNDFARENAWGNTHDMLDSANYVDKYINFIMHLRTTHGVDTKIVCAFGNSISKWTPLNQLNRWRNYITSIVDNRNTSGDEQVYMFEFNANNGPYGEDWHPTIDGHYAMANDITPYLENLMNSVNGTDSTEGYEGFSLFPNPAVDEIFIQSKKQNTNWKLFDINGSMIKTGTENHISLKNVLSGTYFLLVNGHYRRIIKI